jgi:hypothetical protein
MLQQSEFSAVAAFDAAQPDLSPTPTLLRVYCARTWAGGAATDDDAAVEATANSVGCELPQVQLTESVPFTAITIAALDQVATTRDHL